MKKIKNILGLTKAFFYAWLKSLRINNDKRDIAWSITEAFFIGDNAIILRDKFQKELEELVEKHRGLISSNKN